MKRLTRSIVLASLIAFLLMAGCVTSAPQTTPLSGADASQVQALADPLADNILASLGSRDFNAYTRDFDDVMLKLSTKTSFDSMVDNLDKQFGAYQSRQAGKTYKIVQNGQQYYLIVYPLKWEKGSLAMQLSLHYEDPHKVAGLYFK